MPAWNNTSEDRLTELIEDYAGVLKVKVRQAFLCFFFSHTFCLRFLRFLRVFLSGPSSLR
jgi:hypothetical protein